MRNKLTIVVLALLGPIVATEPSSAAIFGRIWQHRRAELRSEISCQLSHQVTQQVNEQVTQQVASATDQLAADMDARLLAEAQRLEEQVQQQLTKMNKAAQEQLAAEGAKLEQLVVNEIAKMHAAAEALVAAKSEQLQQQVETRVAKLQSDADERLHEAIAKFDTDMKESASQNMEDEINKLKSEVKLLVQSEVAAQQEPAPQDVPDEPQPEKQSAITPKPVELKESQDEQS